MKTVFVSGTFNIIHPGHQRLLKFAKGLGDKLIVGVFTDKLLNDQSHINEKLRLEGVSSNNNVDSAILIKSSIEGLILKLKPDIIVKGKEHENKFNEEVNVLSRYGGKLIFSSGESIFSSTDLLSKELHRSIKANIEIPSDYLNRHSIKKGNLIKILKQFNKLRVCVIGDLIVDEYIMCEPIGMSQEDPTLVVSPISNKEFVGGAGIVAGHSAGLGSETNLISVIGKDKLGKKVNNMLNKMGVHSHLIQDETRPTTLKQKFRRQSQSLLKINHLQQHAVGNDIQNEIFTIFKNLSNDIDVLIFSDFNYGCLPQILINKIIKICKSKNIFVAADSQSSSQLGDISKFQEIDLITPTEHEARVSTGNHDDGLVVLSSQLVKKSKARRIFLKLGEEGLLIHNAKQKKGVFLTDKIGALNVNPVDVSGAGDSMLVTSALSLSSGASIWESGILGSIAASIQVGKIGNTSLKSKEIIEFLSQ